MPERAGASYGRLEEGGGGLVQWPHSVMRGSTTGVPGSLVAVVSANFALFLVSLCANLLLLAATASHK